MKSMKIVEFTVRMIVPSEAEAEVAMYKAFSRRMGTTWTRSATPVRELFPKKDETAEKL